MTTEVGRVIVKTANMTQTRNCAVTWNNPPDGGLECLKRWNTITYAVFGKETGESGNPHLQGYVEFRHPVKWTTIHKKLHGAHVEERYKSSPAARTAAYCKKGEQSHREWELEGTEGPNYGLNGIICEWGEISAQGTRNDLHPATEMVRAGKRIREVAEEHPEIFVKYHRGLLALQTALVVPRNEVPEVRVYWGSTGAGKSRKARDWLDEKRYVWWPTQGQWFCGYAGEKDVLLEEFRGQWPFGMLLALLDRYDCKVQYKGGMVEFAGIRIAITSPIHPDKWYAQFDLAANEKLDQLKRRITLIEEVGKKTV